MRKLIGASVLCFMFLGTISVQAQDANASKTKTATTDKAQKDADKAAKKAAKEKAKADKAAAKAAATTPPATTTPPPATVTKPAPAPPKTTTAPKAVTQGTNKSADKAVGTDAKGRTIYEGPKGGRYTLTAAGNKEYIKK